MRLPFHSKSESLADRAQALAGDAAHEARKIVRSLPRRLEGGRERALAVAGAATAAAAGLVFWRSRRDEAPSVHHDPARIRTPWKTAPPRVDKPPAAEPVAGAQAAAPNAAEVRSK
jgi:hypothetical protein